jgi:hypothetical protein
MQKHTQKQTALPAKSAPSTFFKTCTKHTPLGEYVNTQSASDRSRLAWLRFKYRFFTALEGPPGALFWFLHQRGARALDELAALGGELR